MSVTLLTCFSLNKCSRPGSLIPSDVHASLFVGREGAALPVHPINRYGADAMHGLVVF